MTLITPLLLFCIEFFQFYFILSMKYEAKLVLLPSKVALHTVHHVKLLHFKCMLVQDLLAAVCKHNVCGRHSEEGWKKWWHSEASWTQRNEKKRKEKRRKGREMGLCRNRHRHIFPWILSDDADSCMTPAQYTLKGKYLSTSSTELSVNMCNSYKSAFLGKGSWK